MKFNEALKNLKRGIPMKLPEWGGYWKWDDVFKTVDMLCKNGEVLDIRETKDVYFTLSNIAREDWEIAKPENCSIKII